MRSLFRRSEPDVVRPTEPIVYPDGVAVETEKARYFIKGEVKYKFYSDKVFDSWGLKAIPSSEYSLVNYPTAKTVMGFRDGTLVLDFSDNFLYFISNSKRRKVTDPDWLDSLSLDISDAMLASAKEVALHSEGDDLP